MADEQIGTLFTQLVLDNSGFLAELKKSELEGKQAATRIEKSSTVKLTLDTSDYAAEIKKAQAQAVSGAKDIEKNGTVRLLLDNSRYLTALRTSQQAAIKNAADIEKNGTVRLLLDNSKVLMSLRETEAAAIKTATNIQKNFSSQPLLLEYKPQLLKFEADDKSFTAALKRMTESSDQAAFGIGKKLTEGVERAKISLAALEGSAIITAGAIGLLATGVGFLALAFSDWGRASMMMAAKADTLTTSLYAVGGAVGYTRKEMDGFVKGVTEFGVSTMTALSSIVKMTQANLNLADSAHLAKIAQDAATIANIDADQAMEQLIAGVVSGRTMMLKSMGLNIEATAAYAAYRAEMKEGSKELTLQQKNQAILNAIKREAITIEGAHAAALGAAGLAMFEMKLQSEELQLAFGKLFQPALVAAVTTFSDEFKKMSTELQSFVDSGGLDSLAKGMAVIAGTGANALVGLAEALIGIVKILWEFKEVIIAALVLSKLNALIKLATVEWVLFGKAIEAWIFSARALPVLINLNSAAFLRLAAAMKAVPTLLVITVIVKGIEEAYDQIKNGSKELQGYKKAIADMDLEQLNEELKKQKAALEGNGPPIKHMTAEMTQYGVVINQATGGSINAARNIKLLQEQIEKTAKAEADAAVQKDKYTRAQERAARAAAEEQKKIQGMSDTAAIAHANAKATLDIEQANFDASMQIARAKGVAQETIEQRSLDFAYDMAQKRYDIAMEAARKELEILRAKGEAGFNETSWWAKKTNDILVQFVLDQNKAQNKFDVGMAGAGKARSDAMLSATLERMKALNVAYFDLRKNLFELDTIYAEQNSDAVEKTFISQYKYAMDIAKQRKELGEAEAKQEAETQRKIQGANFNEKAFWVKKNIELETEYSKAVMEAELERLKAQLTFFAQRRHALVSYYEDMGIVGQDYFNAQMVLFRQEANEYKKLLGDKFKYDEWITKKTLELYADVQRKKTDYLLEYIDAVDGDVDKSMNVAIKAFAAEANALEENLKGMFDKQQAHEMAVRIMAKKTHDFKINLLEKEISKTNEYLEIVKAGYGENSIEAYKAGKGTSSKQLDIDLSKINRRFFGAGEEATEAEKAMTKERELAEEKIKTATESAKKQEEVEKKLTDALKKQWEERLKGFALYNKGMGNKEAAKQAEAALKELQNIDSKSFTPIVEGIKETTKAFAEQGDETSVWAKEIDEGVAATLEGIKETTKAFAEQGDETSVWAKEIDEGVAATLKSIRGADLKSGIQIAQEFIDGTRKISSEGLKQVGVDVSMTIGEGLKQVGLESSTAVSWAMKLFDVTTEQTLGEAADSLAKQTETMGGKIKMAAVKVAAGIGGFFSGLLKGGGNESKASDPEAAMIDEASTAIAAAYEKRAKDELDIFNKTVDAEKTKYQELIDLISNGGDDKDTFNAMIEGIAGVTKMYEKQQKAIENINDAKKDAEKTTDPKKKLALEQTVAKLESKMITDQISGYRQLAGTISKTFKEGSAGREAFHKIEMGLAAIEMAMEVKNLAFSLLAIATKTGAEEASVAPTVAATMAKATAKGVEAVATQAAAGPYIGFALAAAMIALLVGIGIAIKGGGSSSGSSKMPEVYTPAEGTVLGAKEGTTSESLSKSLEIMEDTYDMEDVALNKIYQELRSLNSNITGLVSNIFRTGTSDFTSFGGMKTGTFADGTAYSSPTGIGWATGMGGTLGLLSSGSFDAKQVFASSMQTFLDSAFIMMGDWLSYFVGSNRIAENFANALFGGETEVKLKKGGIEIGDVLVRSVVDGMDVSARKFAIYKITEEGGLFGSDKTKYKTVYGELDASVVQSLTKMFDSLGTTLVTLSEELGTDVQAVYNYVFETTKLNLKGMDAEEMSKTLTNYFSDIADKAASDLLGSIISQYQQVNEALFETAVRLVRDKNIVQDILELTNTGLTFEAETIRKSRMVVSEAWTEWNTAKENLEKAKRQWFVDAAKALFSGEEAPEFPTLGPEPIKMVEEFYDEVITGTQKLIAFSEALIEKAGSLDNLVEYFNTYYEAFIDEAEKQADLEDKLTRVLKEANVVFPKTRAEYKALVEQFGKGVSDADQEAYVTLLRMSGYADEYFSYLEEALEEAADAQKDYIDSLKEMIKTIDDWLANLNLSELAPGGVSAQAMGAEYARRYEAATKTGATAEDIDAFLNIATDTLNFMKNYTGSDTINYKTIYDSVVQDVTMLQDALKAITGTEDPVADATIESAETLVTISSTLNSILNEMLHSSDTAIALPAHAKGALTTGPAIAGEKGQEWIIPTYEPEKTLFLKEHGKEVLKTITSDKENTIIKNLISSYTFAKGGLTDSDSTGEKELNWMMPTYDIERSRSFKSIGVDSEMIGDRISSYVNQDSKFLDPEIIGKSIARTLINESSDGDNEGSKEMHVHLYIDRKEITESVVAGIRSGDENLLKNLKKVMN